MPFFGKKVRQTLQKSLAKAFKKIKKFGQNKKNAYLCTVKNASAGLKSALNAKSPSK
jgi:hypothetical protein